MTTYSHSPFNYKPRYPIKINYGHAHLRFCIYHLAFLEQNSKLHGDVSGATVSDFNPTPRPGTNMGVSVFFVPPYAAGQSVTWDVKNTRAGRVLNSPNGDNSNSHNLGLFDNDYKFVPDGNESITIMLRYKNADNASRSNCQFGMSSTGTDSLGNIAPNSGGNVHWDFGGQVAPNRLSAATPNHSFTPTQNGNIWTFTKGPKRGMEIWLDNQIVASASAQNPSRTASAEVFTLGRFSNQNLNPCDYSWFRMYNRQIPKGMIMSIIRDEYAPFKNVF